MWRYFEPGYPWAGNVQLAISPKKAKIGDPFARSVGWKSTCPNRPLYIRDVQTQPVLIRVNGKVVTYTREKGYAVLDQEELKKGDKVEIEMPNTGTPRDGQYAGEDN